MLTMVHECLPWQTGNGWKLPTFHNTMHIVSDMCKYGKPKEANTEVGEKNHKVFARKIGRHCQKQHRTFANQVAVRLSDSFVIDKLASAMQLFDEDDDEDCAMVGNAAGECNQESTVGATHCTLYLVNGNKIEVTWRSATGKHLLTWDTDVATFIQYHYMSADNLTTIHCCTEYIYCDVIHPTKVRVHMV
jgi:hypothetical protein